MPHPDDADSLKAMAEAHLEAERAAAAAPERPDPEVIAEAACHEICDLTRAEGPKRDLAWVAAQLRAKAHDCRAHGEPAEVVEAMLRKADEAEARGRAPPPASP